MNPSYKRAFDAVRLSEGQRGRIRGALTSQMIGEQKKMKKRIPYKMIILAAALLALALAGFTFSNQIVHLLGGGRIESGIDKDGGSFTRIDSGFPIDPVEVRDRQIYFTLDGSNLNITSQCSDSTFFHYESLDADGYRHILRIGGTPENVGWAEYVFDKNGKFIGGRSYYPNETEPAWLKTSDLEYLPIYG